MGLVRDEGGRFEAYAAFGLEDLFAMVVRPNKRQTTKEVYLEKADRWASFWPKLRVVPWEDTP